MKNNTRANPIISAVVCTHNNHKLLEKAIFYLLNQNINSTCYEIIIIDNASEDDTAQVGKQFAQTKSNIAYYRENQLGLSHARNRAIKEAKGAWIAYTDDDAQVSTDWIQNILKHITSPPPHMGAMGGKIMPIWERQKPNWLSPPIKSYYVMPEWSQQFRKLRDDEWLSGCNIVFPTHLLKELGGFSTKLGRIGKLLLSDEELEIRKRMESKGWNSWYAPDVLVQHLIQKERISKKWLLKRNYWQGVSTRMTQRELNAGTDRNIHHLHNKAMLQKNVRQLLKGIHPKMIFNEKGQIVLTCLLARVTGYVTAGFHNPTHQTKV